MPASITDTPDPVSAYRDPISAHWRNQIVADSIRSVSPLFSRQSKPIRLVRLIAFRGLLHDAFELPQVVG